MKNKSIQPLWLTHFIEILLVLEFQLTKFIVGEFSYKAHFRPQISSNVFFCDMEGPIVCSKTPHTGKGWLHNTSCRKAKSLKASEHKPQFVLGHDVYMDKVETLCYRALIGRLEYCSMSKEGCIDWVTLHWKPLIHYVPSISLPANRWLVFVFIEESDASLILDKLWPVLDGSLVLKKWHLGFDPLTERVTIKHL